MIEKDYPKLDPLAAQMALNEMQKNAARRNTFTPRLRQRRPWMGTLNWERHKRKLAAKRRAANQMARQTRKAQRRA